MSEKIKKAIEIFKTALPEAKGSFRAMVSERNGNIVEISTNGILYATVNLRSGAVRV